MSKFCPNCGAMNDDNADFCSNCGTGFVATPEKNSSKNSSKNSQKSHEEDFHEEKISKNFSKNSEDIHAEKTEKFSHHDEENHTSVKTREKNFHKNSENYENDDFEDEMPVIPPKRQKTNYHDQSEENEEKSSPILIIVAIIMVCLVGGVIAANEMGVINIFGNKTPETTQTLDDKNAEKLRETTEEKSEKIAKIEEEIDEEPVVETPKKSLDERAEEFIRWHYGELGNGNAYEMWDNYSKEFIRDCEKNKKPSLCDRSKFANLWRTARSVEVIDFRKIEHLNYKYSVKVTDSSGNSKYYVTEMTLHETSDSFLITWYNAS